ncbi:MAG: hypothetical protein AAGA83_00330 [Cyanobacteria bacterium P01_F01_bin.116]
MPEVAGQNKLNQAVAIGADKLPDQRHALFVVSFTLDSEGNYVAPGSETDPIAQIQKGLGVSQTLYLFREESSKNIPYQLVNGASSIWDLNIINRDNAINYVKVYGKHNPTVGTDIPFFTIKVEANSTYYWKPVPIYSFDTGIAIAITTGLLAADTGAPTNGCLIEGRVSSTVQPIFSF